MLANVKVRTRIDIAMAQRSKRTGINADRVLEELAKVKTLDLLCIQLQKVGGAGLYLHASDADHPPGGVRRASRPTSQRAEEAGSSSFLPNKADSLFMFYQLQKRAKSPLQAMLRGVSRSAILLSPKLGLVQSLAEWSAPEICIRAAISPCPLVQIAA